MLEVKERFDSLSKEDKIRFIKEIMPEMCNLFGENPTQMMSEMMPLCQDMMKDYNMDMSKMMTMMKR